MGVRGGPKMQRSLQTGIPTRKYHEGGMSLAVSIYTKTCIRARALPLGRPRLY